MVNAVTMAVVVWLWQQWVEMMAITMATEAVLGEAAAVVVEAVLVVAIKT